MSDRRKGPRMVCPVCKLHGVTKQRWRRRGGAWRCRYCPFELPGRMPAGLDSSEPWYRLWELNVDHPDRPRGEGRWD